MLNAISKSPSFLTLGGMLVENCKNRKNLARFDIELVEHDRVSHASHVVKKQGPEWDFTCVKKKVGNLAILPALVVVKVQFN